MQDYVCMAGMRLIAIRCSDNPCMHGQLIPQTCATDAQPCIMPTHLHESSNIDDAQARDGVASQGREEGVLAVWGSSCTQFPRHADGATQVLWAPLAPQLQMTIPLEHASTVTYLMEQAL